MSLVAASHPGTGDCEQVRDGWLAQPVNALSSLSFLAAAGALWRTTRGSDRLFAVLVGANAVGSFGFHGPGDDFSHWLHDAALAGTLAFIVAADVPARTAVVVTLTAGAGTVLAVAPDSTNLVTGLLGAGVVAAEARRFWQARSTGDGRRRLRRFGLPAALMGAAIAVNALTRTDRALCRPESLLQGHAAWHVLTAAALWAWGSAALAQPERAVTSG